MATDLYRWPLETIPKRRFRSVFTVIVPCSKLMTLEQGAAAGRIAEQAPETVLARFMEANRRIKVVHKTEMWDRDNERWIEVK